MARAFSAYDVRIPDLHFDKWKQNFIFYEFANTANAEGVA
jgi:hypothetical protein